MRSSRPMPRATSCTSAPTFSQRSAISLMKVILVARNALAAYLISSAVRRSVNRIGVCVEIERAIELAHHLARAPVVGADDDAVGPLEVVDGGALAQEFRVGDDVELRLRLGFADDALDLVAGADRHRRFRHDDGVAVDRGGDFARGGVDVGLRSAWPSPRRDGVPTAMNTTSASLTAAARSVAKESRPSLTLSADQFVEAGLEDRNFAALAAPRSCPRPCRRKRPGGRNRRSRRRRRDRHNRCRSWRYA